jgi:hypothetical protein
METDRHNSVREALQRLPARVPPAQLRAQLRSMALRERVRNSQHRDWADSIQAWIDHAQFTLENLMRPFALPTAGGIMSAIVLFSMLMPGITVVRANVAGDVPISLTTSPAVRGVGPVMLGDEDIVVELTIDEQGRMIDYEIVAGEQFLRDAVVRRNLESNLLLTQFTPATSFGQATTSRIRLSLSRSRVDVKG